MIEEISNNVKKINEYSPNFRNDQDDPLEDFDDFIQNYAQKTFPEITPITDGIYYYSLKKWLSVFKKHEITIIDAKTLIEEPWEIIIDLQKFLSLPGSKNEEFLVTKKNFYYNYTSGLYCLKGVSTGGTSKRIIYKCPNEKMIAAKKLRGKIGLSWFEYVKLSYFYQPFQEKYQDLLKNI